MNQTDLSPRHLPLLDKEGLGEVAPGLVSAENTEETKLLRDVCRIANMMDTK